MSLPRRAGAVLLLLLLTLPAAHEGVEAATPSRAKVLGLSMLLPGLGHQALGSTTKAQAFMAADAVVWSAFGVFELQGARRKDSYVEMAEIFAGVPDADGRSGEYYRLLGRYRTSEEYDDEIRRDARARYPDDLEARAAYFESHRVAPDEVWSWSSQAAWDRYQEKRSDSNLSFKRARYMLGVALANRLLSAVDAMRIVHRKRAEDRSLGLSLLPDPDPREPVRLCVTIPLP